MKVSRTAVYKLSIEDIREALAQYMDTNYGKNIGDNFDLNFNLSRDFYLDVSNEGFDTNAYKEVISSIDIHVKD